MNRPTALFPSLLVVVTFLQLVGKSFTQYVLYTWYYFHRFTCRRPIVGGDPKGRWGNPSGARQPLQRCKWFDMLALNRSDIKIKRLNFFSLNRSSDRYSAPRGGSVTWMKMAKGNADALKIAATSLTPGEKYVSQWCRRRRSVRPQSNQKITTTTTTEMKNFSFDFRSAQTTTKPSLAIVSFIA